MLYFINLFTPLVLCIFFLKKTNMWFAFTNVCVYISSHSKLCYDGGLWLSVRRSADLRTDINPTTVTSLSLSLSPRHVCSPPLLSDWFVLCVDCVSCVCTNGHWVTAQAISVLLFCFCWCCCFVGTYATSKTFLRWERVLLANMQWKLHGELYSAACPLHRLV